MTKTRSTVVEWETRCTRDFHRSKLQKGEKERCLSAIQQFQIDCKRPSLNLEFLGHAPNENHYSIRASKELRIILALDWKRYICVLANMGHHDVMYNWSDRQRRYTDPTEAIDLNRNTTSGSSIDEQIRALSNFEEWMLFLHPTQRPLVKRRYAGAARIRGAAGTGKTVAALHRAAALGRRYSEERVLFTSFSRSLCNRFEETFRQLPDAPHNVDFYNIDRVAYDYLRGEQWVDRRAVDDGFEAAYQRVVPGSSIRNLDRDYLRQEIEKVIKGRNPTRKAYLDTDRFERLGRKRSLNKNMRAACWRLAEAWDRELCERQTTNYPDLLIAARDQAWKQASGIYRSVIVDEAQDMTLVGMQFVRALVAGTRENSVPPDGVLMVDDGAQRIYAGGFRPIWADLNVRGSSEELRTNYRNTGAILTAAKAIRDGAPPASDGDDFVHHADVQREEGDRPVFRRASNGELAVALDIIEDMCSDGFEHREIALLTRNNADAEQIYESLRRKDIPVAKLKDARDGSLPDGIRVGTFDRAKGWEFRAVLIVRLGASRFPQQIETNNGEFQQTTFDGMETVLEELSDEEKEARMLDIGRLYVGMTRARDRLFLIADEEPCEELGAALDYFDCPLG